MWMVVVVVWVGGGRVRLFCGGGERVRARG